MADPPANARWAYAAPLGSRLPFDLDSPCSTFERSLRCGARAGYIEVAPFGESFHYKQSCENDHYARHVPRREVELRLGLPAIRTARGRRTPLDPARRVALNVLIRDRCTCVYCGRRAGDVELDGSPIVVTHDHIIPEDLIDVEGLRLDRELLQFARDIQLVCACRAHGSAKGNGLLAYEDALRVFVRHVLKGETRGTNVGMTSFFERLYHIAQKAQSTRNAPNLTSVNVTFGSVARTKPDDG